MGKKRQERKARQRARPATPPAPEKPEYPPYPPSTWSVEEPFDIGEFMKSAAVYESNDYKLPGE